MWKPHSSPPSGSRGEWSAPVVAFTNYGKVHLLMFFTSEDGGPGCWQRPEAFEDGEKVLLWTERPED